MGLEFLFHLLELLRRKCNKDPARAGKDFFAALVFAQVSLRIELAADFLDDLGVEECIRTDGEHVLELKSELHCYDRMPVHPYRSPHDLIEDCSHAPTVSVAGRSLTHRAKPSPSDDGLGSLVPEISQAMAVRSVLACDEVPRPPNIEGEGNFFPRFQRVNLRCSHPPMMPWEV